jgi:hypothetical protein
VSSYPRDLVGYADQPPAPYWPGGARLSLNFVVNLHLPAAARRRVNAITIVVFDHDFGGDVEKPLRVAVKSCALSEGVA